MHQHAHQPPRQPRRLTDRKGFRYGCLPAIVITWILIVVSVLTGGDEPASKPEAKAPAPATSSAFLRPTPAQEKTLLEGLTAIDPGLTVKEDRAVRRSVGVCDDIRTGKDQDTIIKNAAYRYDGGNASVDAAKAERIVQVIKDSYCEPR